MKPSRHSVFQTKLCIKLEEKVEETLVDFSGQPTTKPNFYKTADENWQQYPCLIMFFGLMIKRAVDDGFVYASEEQDFA